MYACQIKLNDKKATLLPRKVFDVEKIGDARREYCEMFDLDEQYIRLGGLTPYCQGIWIEMEEVFNEQPDVTVY